MKLFLFLIRMLMEKLIAQIFNNNTKIIVLLIVYNLLALLFYTFFCHLVFNLWGFLFNHFTERSFIDPLYEFLSDFGGTFLIYNWKILLFLWGLFLFHFIFKIKLFIWYKDNNFEFPYIYKKIRNIDFILFLIFSLSSLSLLILYYVQTFILQVDVSRWVLTYLIIKLHNILWWSFFFFLDFYWWVENFYFHYFLSFLIISYSIYLVKKINKKNNWI